YFNYCRPHMTRTKEEGVKTTPAMAAGLESRPWTLRELLERSTPESADVGFPDSPRGGGPKKLGPLGPLGPLPGFQGFSQGLLHPTYKSASKFRASRSPRFASPLTSGARPRNGPEYSSRTCLHDAGEDLWIR